MALDSLDISLLAFVWTLFVIATLLTGIRLFIRLRFRRRPWSEVFVILAWSLYFIEVLCETIQTVGCSDRTWEMLMKINSTVFFQIYYACKTALLCFFLELAPRQSFPKTWWAIMITWVCVIAGSASELAFEIRDVWKDIYFSHHGSIAIRARWFVSSILVHMVTDIQVLALPIPILWHLPIPRKEKIAAYCVFAFGFVNVLCAAGYTAWCFGDDESDSIHNFILFLNDFQQGSAVMVVSLPYCRSLWNLWRGRSKTVRSEDEPAVPKDGTNSITAVGSTDVKSATQSSAPPEKNIVARVLEEREAGSLL